MKLVVIGDHREQILDVFEVILKHWGYRVMVSSNQPQIKALLKEMTPDLVIMGTDILQQNDLKQVLSKTVLALKCPLILLTDGDIGDLEELAPEILHIPLDIFSFFQMIQKHLEKIPRQNMRLTVQLPGMLSTGGDFCFAEVLSLSSRGMFLKHSSRLEKGDQVKVIFPLLGMKKEMEVKGKILYHIKPAPENNYLEGVGIEFLGLEGEDLSCLEKFIEKCFLGELNASPSTQGTIQAQPSEEGEALALRLKRIA
ncbi:MAG: PilZ domain-containing protein [Deltaproteobacteria bacterium]|nr:PilZ domain-containing protein [Deltaproteobacteria bacterium]